MSNGLKSWEEKRGGGDGKKKNERWKEGNEKAGLGGSSEDRGGGVGHDAFDERAKSRV